MCQSLWRAGLWTVHVQMTCFKQLCFPNTLRKIRTQKSGLRTRNSERGTQNSEIISSTCLCHSSFIVTSGVGLAGGLVSGLITAITACVGVLFSFRPSCPLSRVLRPIPNVRTESIESIERQNRDLDMRCIEGRERENEMYGHTKLCLSTWLRSRSSSHHAIAIVRSCSGCKPSPGRATSRMSQTP